MKKGVDISCLLCNYTYVRTKEQTYNIINYKRMTEHESTLRRNDGMRYINFSGP